MQNDYSIVGVRECLRDSPKFRQALLDSEQQFDHFDSHLEKIVKSTETLRHDAQQFGGSHRKLISLLGDLLQSLSHTPSLVESVRHFISAFEQMSNYFNILVEQLGIALCTNLCDSLRKLFADTKLARAAYEKSSCELDTALARNAQLSRLAAAHEQQEVAETRVRARATFRHHALQYTRTLSQLHVRRLAKTLQASRCVLFAHSTYFHQCLDVCEDVKTTLMCCPRSVWSTELEETQCCGDTHHSTVCVGDDDIDYESLLNRSSDSSHTVPLADKVTSTHGGHLEDSSGGSQVSVGRSTPTTNDRFRVVIDGYLFKRSSGAFRLWNRRWFTLEGGRLYYQKRCGDPLPTLMEADIRLCRVRALDTECDRRRFCFELLTPGRTHVMQAETGEEREQWLHALTSAVGAALSRGVQPALARAGCQEVCADCGHVETSWASLNLGATLCIECSGVHRSLGVHRSKVKSLALDHWEPLQSRLLAAFSNQLVNSVYEARVPAGCVARATPTCARALRTAWIHSKYVDRCYTARAGCTQQQQEEAADQSLLQAASRGSLVCVYRALALGAKCTHADEDGNTALHLAALLPDDSSTDNHSVLIALYLLLNGADINAANKSSHTGLHLAVINNNIHLLCLLLKQKADQHLRDQQGHTALDLAVARADADMVTVLRVALLNEQMCAAEQAGGAELTSAASRDDTFEQVVNDFTSCVGCYNGGSPGSRGTAGTRDTPSSDSSPKTAASPSR